jgi:hypothetical protein
MGGEITPAIRTFLAAVLRGEAKRPPKTRRPIKGATLTGQAEAAALVFKLKPVQEITSGRLRERLEGTTRPDFNLLSEQQKLGRK